MSIATNSRTSRSRILSYISYASSSIFFDILAYSMSGKFLELLQLHQTYLFTLSLLMLQYLPKYVSALSMHFPLATIQNFALLFLALFSFLSGVCFHRRVVHRKSKDDEKLSQRTLYNFSEFKN